MNYPHFEDLAAILVPVAILAKLRCKYPFFSLSCCSFARYTEEQTLQLSLSLKRTHNDPTMIRMTLHHLDALKTRSLPLVEDQHSSLTFHCCTPRVHVISFVFIRKSFYHL